MLKLDVSPRATKQLEKILEHIKRDSPNGAAKVKQDFKNATQFLCEHPLAGSEKSEFTDKQVRFLALGNYWIVYTQRKTTLRVVSILHAARDVPKYI